MGSKYYSDRYIKSLETRLKHVFLIFLSEVPRSQLELFAVYFPRALLVSSLNLQISFEMLSKFPHILFYKVKGMFSVAIIKKQTCIPVSLLFGYILQLLSKEPAPYPTVLML
jgi:hypothetical protein